MLPLGMHRSGSSVTREKEDWKYLSSLKLKVQCFRIGLRRTVSFLGSLDFGSQLSYHVLSWDGLMSPFRCWFFKRVFCLCAEPTCEENQPCMSATRQPLHSCPLGFVGTCMDPAFAAWHLGTMEFHPWNWAINQSPALAPAPNNRDQALLICGNNSKIQKEIG